MRERSTKPRPKVRRESQPRLGHTGQWKYHINELPRLQLLLAVSTPEAEEAPAAEAVTVELLAEFQDMKMQPALERALGRRGLLKA